MHIIHLYSYIIKLLMPSYYYLAGNIALAVVATAVVSLIAAAIGVCGVFMWFKMK